MAIDSVFVAGAVSLVLLSFWVERFLRIMLNALSLFILIAMLLILADHAPNYYTPTVGKYNIDLFIKWFKSLRLTRDSVLIYYITVVYYTCSLYAVWASLLTFTIHCWFKERKPNIELFTQIASSTWVQTLFGMSFDDVSLDCINEF